MAGSKHQPEGTRRQQILLAADLVLIEAGVEGFTVDQVVDRAKIAKGTVYKYFKSKDQIFAELSIKAASLLLEKFKEGAAPHTHSLDKIKAVCRKSFEFNQEYPAYYTLISHIERPEFEIDIQGYIKMSSSIVDFMVGIVEYGQRRGEIRPELNPEVVDYIMWACCIGVIQFIETKQRLIKKIHDIDIEEFIHTFSEMMASALKF